jgi:predicted nucleic acid-binding protein
LELISIKAIIIEIKSNLQVCRDKKDDYLLNLAIDSSADFLISGDKDLLILNQVDKTKVIKLVDFEKDVLSGL